MKCIIITIGNELLIGQTIDTNSVWIAKQLNAIGIQVFERIAISDNETHILDTMHRSVKNADLVLITGGLGPTNDDITKTVLCKFFNTELVLNQGVLEWVTEIFAKKNKPLLPVNRLQAMVPQNCIVLHNAMGTAPGMLWTLENHPYIAAMPGVPHEMEYIMNTHVLPLLADKSQNIIIHKSIYTENIGEAFLAEHIKDFENRLPKGVSLAYLPEKGKVKLRLTGIGNKNSEIRTLTNNLATELKSLVGSWFVAEGEL